MSGDKDIELANQEGLGKTTGEIDHREGLGVVGDTAHVLKATGNPQEWTFDQLVTDHDTPWYRKPHLLKLNLLLIIPLLSSTVNGYDGSMLNGLQSMSQWQESLDHPKGVRLGQISGVINYGGLLAATFVPWFSDKTGRRLGICIGNVIVTLGAALQGASQSYGMFLASRAVLGFGLFFSTVNSPLLICELAYPTHRPIMVGFYNNLWVFGSMLAAWITYGCYFMGPTSWAWRIPSILQGALPIFTIALIYLVPESPRWLVQKGKYTEARSVLAKWHAGGDTDAPLVDFEMDQITLQIDTASTLSTSSSYLDFFRTKGNRHRLFILVMISWMWQCSGNQLISFYLHLILDSIGLTSSVSQLRINGGLTCFNLVCAVSMNLLVEKAGRRRLFLFSTISMTLIFTIWTILSAINQQRDFMDKGLGAGVVVMIFFFELAHIAGFNGPSYVYTTEILPTSLRAKGSNIVQVLNVSWNIFNSYVNPIAMDAIEWKYYIVWCLVIGVIDVPVVYFFFPETRRRTLEEVAVIFDGEQAFHRTDGKSGEGDAESQAPRGQVNV